MSIPPPIEVAISLAGGLTRLSRLLSDASPPAVAKWRRNGVPLERCAEIERALDGRVRCEFLRDDVTWLRDEHDAVTGWIVHVAPADRRQAA